eukprot:6304914-Amphidinium_carterae.2
MEHEIGNGVVYVWIKIWLETHHWATTTDPNLFSKHDEKTGALLCCMTTHVDDLKNAATPQFSNLLEEVLIE